MKKVQILMSTYNGMKYLPEQLKSIEKQDYSNITLLIRDDGSTDGTIEYLREYQENHINVNVLQGNNIGVCKSFFELINKADKKADFYALSDQDDYWLPDKVSSALLQIENETHTPLLYCCNKTITDELLNPILLKVKYEMNLIPSFENALVENICTGCTCIFNKALNTIISQNIPEYVIMHDWWIYLLASAFGKVIYDKNPHILYRQHDNNVHGTITSKRMLIKHRLKELTNKRGKIYLQLENLIKLNILNETQTKMVCLILNTKHSFFSRIQLCCNNRISRQGRNSNLLFKCIVLIGKL